MKDPKEIITSVKVQLSTLTPDNVNRRIERLRSLLHDAERLLETEKSKPASGRPAWVDAPEEKVFQPTEVASVARAQVIDIAGRRWEWNCGWRCLTPSSHDHGGTPPVLGHLAFGKIPKATVQNINARTVKIVERPVGEWRRWISEASEGVKTTFHHGTFGDGHVLANDGLRAIFKPFDTVSTPSPVPVMFKNLTEIKPVVVTTGKRKSAVTRKPKYTIEDLL